MLFIDEAYSLGNPEGRDMFSKECLDTLNQNLTENKITEPKKELKKEELKKK